jgi:hypothetical protein
VNAERIEQARRFGGELCDIDGCTEYGTLEHVTAHLAAAERRRCPECGGTAEILAASGQCASCDALDNRVNAYGTEWSVNR